MRSYGNQSFAGSLPRFNARLFDCRNGLRSNNYFVVISRNLWRKLLAMNVLTIAAAKIKKKKKTEQKGQLLGQNRAEVLFIGRGSGGQILQHKNCVRSLSNPKPMFSTVLELTTTRFITNRRSKFAWAKFPLFHVRDVVCFLAYTCVYI